MSRKGNEGSRTLDRSKGVVAPRRWEETIRDAMLQLTNDELASFLASNPEETKRLEICLKRARAIVRPTV
jgi:hypothetical protein